MGEGVSSMEKLIGKKCRCEFDLPHTQWPIEGFPAWVVVISVSMPLVEMKSAFGGLPMWINASKIARILAVE